MAHLIDVRSLFLILIFSLFMKLIYLYSPGFTPSYHSYLALLVPAPGENLALPRQHQIEGVPRRYLHNVRPILK